MFVLDLSRSILEFSIIREFVLLTRNSCMNTCGGGLKGALTLGYSFTVSPIRDFFGIPENLVSLIFVCFSYLVVIHVIHR